MVIDASALSAIILKEEGWEELLDASDFFLSLELAVKEASNAIWKALVMGRISREEAKECYSILKELVSGGVLVLKDQLKYLDDAMGLAISRNITVYDALYIVMALKEGLCLLTLDQKQAQVARAEGVKVLP